MLTIKRPHPYNVNEVFSKESYTSNGYTMPYRLYIPKNYDCGVMYPVVIFLHDSGERGINNDTPLNDVQIMFNDPESPIYDSIVLVPQCPENRQWVYTPWANGNYSTDVIAESRELEAVLEILDNIIELYNVDEDRVYVTGVSMGGYGTWDLLMRHGARFAAGLPICGGGDTTYAKLLTRIPIMTFHGSDDPVIPVESTRTMYASIVKEGGTNIFYTEFDGEEHCISNAVYSDLNVLRWLFEQSRLERRLRAEKKAKLKKTAIAAGGGAGVILSILLLVMKKKKKK